MKRPLSLAVFLLCCSGVVARSAPIAGVVLQSYDQPASGSYGQTTPGQPTSGQCVAHLVNMSHKFVTEVDIGVSRPGQNEPFNEATFSWANDAFAPGATKDVFFGPCDESVKVVLDVAVYDDLTAESLNDRALQHIIEARQRGLMTAQKINEVITKAARPQQNSKNWPRPSRKCGTSTSSICILFRCEPQRKHYGPGSIRKNS